MPRKRFTPEQIIGKLREAEIFLSKGLTAQQAARKLGATEIMVYVIMKVGCPPERFMVEPQTKGVAWCAPNNSRRYSPWKCTLEWTCIARKLFM